MAAVERGQKFREFTLKKELRPKFHSCFLTYEMLCVICYHLENLKNMKNIHGLELLLVKL